MKKLIIIPILSLLIFSACGQTGEINNADADKTQNPKATVDASAQPDDPKVSAERSGDNDFLRANGIEIFVESPAPGETVSSPLTLKGKAMGNWFFEGVLPISMEDSKGNLLSAAPARALSDWMTEDYVEFEATLAFDPADNQTATLVIKNDNPSGLPENSKMFKVPVKLAPAT